MGCLRVLAVVLCAWCARTEGYFQNDFGLFPDLPMGVPRSENSVCRQQSELFVDNLRNLTLWAHEMWDATAKASTGVLRGNIFQMGHFEQCLTSKAPFETQYCLATVRIHVPALDKPDRDSLALEIDPGDSVLDRLYRYSDRSKQPRDTINLGWCVPASCTIQDLDKSLNEYLSSVETPLDKKNVTYTASIRKEFCQRASEKQHYNAVDYSFCLLTLIFVVLVLLSTTYDYHSDKEVVEEKDVKKSVTQKLLLSFSARTNFWEMAQAETTNPDLSVLYGLRTISIMVIILDHRFGTFTSSALINFDYVEKQYRAPFACMVFHGDLFVDTFFLLSGLLVAYGLLTQFDKRMVNPGFIIFLRYIRLTPVYAFVIFYYASLFDYSGNGPLWKVIAGADAQDCRDNWWANLLYINNYVNAEHMCMTHAWYLPCDFHYFIIAIGICMLIKKEKKIGLSALLTTTVISMIIPFILTVVYRRPSMLMFYPDFLTGPKTHADFLLTYSKSHARATPYFIGMFGGYIYYRLKGKKYHVCRIKSALLIVLSIAAIATSVLSGAVFYDPYHPYEPYESAAYAGFHRALWALGSIGIIYVASYGHASFISKILTWSPWVALSKLQYGAYLIHMQFQLRSAANFMNPRYITYFDLVSLSASDMVLAFVAALALYLMIEAPFRKIFKELLNPKREPKGSKSALEEPQSGTSTAAEPEPRHVLNNNNNYIGSHNRGFEEDSRL
ncbi:nose resistant to fluoxetine protein 6-like [Anthonomus grandis grandis]|uniref:nose resistant to fluoxetine protein 6-like n=1 Tax=Anthonomus grandis grandis TaxID=2921223 RepID=UPI002164F16D|nr:nose resistant to fluoxetine protein 6-like [Anthonomus grandis grandis]